MALIVASTATVFVASERGERHEGDNGTANACLLLFFKKSFVA